jgi:hypothetical protein
MAAYHLALTRAEAEAIEPPPLLDVDNTPTSARIHCSSRRRRAGGPMLPTKTLATIAWPTSTRDSRPSTSTVTSRP